jgi:hypothetical protein
VDEAIERLTRRYRKQTFSTGFTPVESTVQSLDPRDRY